MRVIFLNRYFYPDHSATSQRLFDLAFFLAGAGHRVCVVTSCQRYRDAAAGLADQLLRLAGDAVLCEAMGARARALLCARYDKKIAVKAWLELLGEL